MARQLRTEVPTKVDIKAALAEGVGTMLFVLMGAGTVVVSGSLNGGALDPARLVAIAVAHGLGILTMVSMTASISGGHLNPAVTFAVFLTGKIGLRRGVSYIVAQLVGAAIGALIIKLVVPAAIAGNLGSHGLGNGVSVGAGLLTEIVLTMALVLVIFGAAVDKKGPNIIAPIAIGFTVMLIHLFAVPLTGASVNPARSFGPALMSGTFGNFWIYLVGPLVGGAIGGLLYQCVFMNRKD
ncbi:MAG: MIP family channel protein [Dehalococcoidia bacterium]|nr:MIP family channel protein [Dehalococcoidia bacterium]